MKNLLVLIIYMLFSLLAYSQSFHLNMSYKKNINSTNDSIIKLKFKNKTVKQIQDSISRSLNQDGYLNHIIKYTNTNENIAQLEIILNNKYSHIRINNLNKTIISNNLLSLSRKRNTIAINDVENYLKEIKNKLNQDGYSFSEVQLSQFILNNTDTIAAELKINTTTQRYLNKIIVKGYEDFPIHLLRNFTKRKNIYNNKTLNKLEQSISNMQFVKKTKETEVLFKKDSTQIFLYLEKITTNTADGLIGFNNSNEGKLELNGFISLNLQNNLNRAETFSLEYRNDTGEQTQFMTTIEIPYLWKSSIGSSSNLSIQRRDSTYQRTTFKTGIFYKPNWQSNLGINYINTTSTALDNNLDSEDFTKNGIEINGEITKVKTDKLLPEDFQFKATIGWNKREINNDSQNQWNFHATIMKLWHLTNRSMILGTTTSYYLKSDDIQFNELYQFGGLGSIRGFNQNSIDSSFYTTIATEYRYRLNDQIYLHSILDIGVFENFNSKKVENLYGYGGGIGILTQAGVLNVSVANGRFSDAKVDLSSTVAHINLKINF